MTSVIMVHRGNFTVKYSFINNSPSAEIENLVKQHRNGINQTWSIEFKLRWLTDLELLLFIKKEKRQQQYAVITVISLFALPTERKLLFTCIKDIEIEENKTFSGF